MFASGGLREPAPYRIDTWKAEDGLPQSSVTVVTQTRDGYLWLGTFGGVARFDGIRFKVFGDNKTSRLPRNRILSVFQDRHDTLWLASEDGGLIRAAGGRFDMRELPNRGTFSRFVKAFAESSEPGFWMLSAEGQLLRFTADKISVPSTNWNLRGNAAQAIAVDTSGRLWVGTDKELAVWQGEHFVSCWDASQEQGFNVEGLGSSHTGGMWVAANGRLRKLQNGEWQKDYGPYPWSKGALSDVVENPDGEVWLGIYGSGLYRYTTNGQCLHLGEDEGLPGNLVRCLRSDREGNLWVGTEGHGLARIKPAVFRSYGRKQGLASESKLTVCEGQDGELWIGSNGGGIDRLEHDAVQHYGANEGLTNEYVWSVCQGRDKTLWAGTWGAGLFRLRGGRFEQFGPEEAGSVVCALYRDSEDILWLGQMRDSPEIACVRGGKTELVKLGAETLPLDIRAMTRDSSGALWIGTMGDGLFRLSQGKETRFSRKNGLSNEFILALYSDTENVLWIGTREGLNRLQDGKISFLTVNDGLPDGTVVSIAEDNHRTLWCGSGAGVFRVSKDELNQRACGNGITIHCYTYTRADGLPSLECSSGCQPSVCKTRDGRLWFPTVNGLAVVDPERVPFNSLAPPVVIEDVSIDGTNVLSAMAMARGEASPSAALQAALPARLEVPPGRRRFEFRFTGLSLTVPEKVHFKYKLEGLDDRWVECGTERVAHYSYLGHGDYRFQVLAANNDGVWNDTGAVLALIVLPHVWQTWWFRVGAVTVLMLLVGAAVEIRLALERRVTRLRLRMARDLHDEVGSNLGTIALLSEVLGRQNERLTEELGEIRRVAAQTIDSLRDIVWFLDPAADNMEELLSRMKEAARTMLRGAAFQFVCQGEANAPKPSLELRRNLFPMFKEILHNVSSHARATNVAIAITITNGRFRLCVEDNGIGFDASRVHGGNGLKNLRRRADDLRGALDITSTHGKGTVVTFTAPLR